MSCATSQALSIDIQLDRFINIRIHTIIRITMITLMPMATIPTTMLEMVQAVMVSAPPNRRMVIHR